MSKAAPRAAVYVTAHGFGHATRSAALCAELARRVPGIELSVRTGVPARFFEGLSVSPSPPDPGIAQKSALDVDGPAALAAHEAIAKDWRRLASEETAFLKQGRFSLVVCDAPALPCAAAAAAGVPSAIVSNFTWDWVMRGFEADEPRWAPVAGRWAEAYGRASLGLRLPGSGGFESAAKVEDAPLLVTRGRLSRPEARAALGVPQDGLKSALVSFGGFGAPGAPRGRFPGWRFLGMGPKPAGLDAPWTALPDPGGRPQLAPIAAADVVVTKPGYGTFSECLAAGARALYVPRPDYRESVALAGWIARAGVAAELPRAAFESGEWLPFLEALAKRPAPAPADAGGAEAIADRLARLL